MSARIIDGLAIARDLRPAIRARAAVLTAQGMTPGLAVILVGDHPASRIYVRNKVRACAEVGIRSQVIAFSDAIAEAELLACVQSLNEDPTVHGILVQLPLPPSISLRHVLEGIAIEKDVDGFHLYNVGGLVIGDTVFPPCTPYGVRKLLEHERIDIAGKNVTIIGASNIVGKPLALMMLQQEATVAVCHARTRDLTQYTILADILVVAAGRPRLVVPEMVRTGAVVIDVGINRGKDGRFVGDVDFEGVRRKASHITPVPGGVGPMTVTMLLENTVVAAEHAAAGGGSGRAPAARGLPRRRGQDAL
jgi:methylenetetrahydrofolate dehydrogenase (NADP+)/methenyltetrahydrofolate cyclohydrolase